MSAQSNKKPRTRVINGPFEKPGHHWRFNSAKREHDKVEGRRPAGYVIYDTRRQGRGARSDLGSRKLIELRLANEIRPQVESWRDKEYPGVTNVSRRLLAHWGGRKPEPDARPFFFCQLEAAETLIWLAETRDGQRVAADILTDGGPFPRVCTKLATGTGKTVVMGMLTAWQALNAVSRPRDARFSRDFLVVAPGLTVKRRLEALRPSREDNIYDEFLIVPQNMRDQMNQARLKIHNWHALAWDTDEKLAARRTVDKRGAWSDEVYAQNVLGNVGESGRLVVINDEAHHAWRPPEGGDIFAETEGRVWRLPKGVKIQANKDDKDEAKVWVRGLDRLHKTRRIQQCYDFSATPFVPTGHAHMEDTVFPWVVSDFGLNDAIESGLVKIPRIVTRDNALMNAETRRSRLWHIYADPEVEDDIKKKDSTREKEPLPDLIRQAYAMLGEDWAKKRPQFMRGRNPPPPVMISVVNNTTTAARVAHAIQSASILDGACAASKTRSINSETLKKAEMGEGDEDANKLREMVHGVGKPGSDLEHLISVAMLSEGWDAKTVTHIMGLRAFNSQLLCEQVVGRGLRRMDYTLKDGKFPEESVIVFGVPFDILEDDGGGGKAPMMAPKTRVELLPERERECAMTWPRVLRVNMALSERLTLDWKDVPRLVLNDYETLTRVEMGAVVDGKGTLADLDLNVIDLEGLDRFRTQKLAFEAALSELGNRPDWPGDRAFEAAQLILLAEEFFDRNVDLNPLPSRKGRGKDVYKRLMLGLNFTRILRHFIDHVKRQNTERLIPIFDEHAPIGGTAYMRPPQWDTGRPCVKTRKSHLNFCVVDQGWEHFVARKLDRMAEVQKWVKNDHRVGFEIEYSHAGMTRKYLPDFLIGLPGGLTLILEVTGRAMPEKQAKMEALNRWVEAINEHGGFGIWEAAQATKPDDAEKIIRRLCKKHPA